MRFPALVFAGLLAGCGFAQEDPPKARGGAFGVPGLVAEARPAIKQGGCGISNPVAVTEVAGVRLSQPAVMRRETAAALSRWLTNSAIPAVGKRGGGLAELHVVAHYACRTRNNRKGAKLSEHAKGNAIDIAAFRMRDGSAVTVLGGWNAKGDRKLLRQLHKSACGPFGTVLGPNADRHHRDHFHFDTAPYRSGPYCR